MMIPLIDSSPAKIATLAMECGFERFGQLQTPLTGYSNFGGMWACDNGGFSRQDLHGFMRFLSKRKEFQSKCLWVTVPDIVGSAARTLDLYRHLSPAIIAEGWPVAFVCQNGQESIPLPDRWDALFIGGDTEWKLSIHAKNLIDTAKWLGKPVHIGRVNTARRWEHFNALGADTFDGSGIARPYPGFDKQRAAIKNAVSLHMNSLLSPAPTADTIGWVNGRAVPVDQGSLW